MSKMKNPLLNLANFLVEEIFAMSDEEILAEATPEEIAEAKRLHDEVLANIKTTSGEHNVAGHSELVVPAKPLALSQVLLAKDNSEDVPLSLHGLSNLG